VGFEEDFKHAATDRRQAQTPFRADRVRLRQCRLTTGSMIVLLEWRIVGQGRCFTIVML
jgi:hypothetical protein